MTGKQYLWVVAGTIVGLVLVELAWVRLFGGI